MKHKLESRLLREIINLRYADDTTLMAEREEELKSVLIKVKEASEKAGLKLNPQTRRGLTLLSQLCREPAVGVRNGEEA